MSLDPAHPPSSYEIERKFLVKELPSNLEKYECRRIEQGYLAVERNGTQVRLRRAGSVCSLTVKRGGGMTRHEWEIEVTELQFQKLWPATEGRRLRKTRYDVPFENFTIEVDIYDGHHKGLIVAEVEFDDEDQCQRFQPPAWLGQDVSGQPRYSNIKLARE